MLGPGLKGKVIEVGKDQILVQMDKPFDGGEPRDNQVQVSSDFCGNGQSLLDLFWTEFKRV